MPPITSYDDSVILHEARFTAHFAEHGFTWAAAHPLGEDQKHPVMNNAVELLRDGCPIFKRRAFFHDPLYFEAHSTNPRDILDTAVELGYPGDLAISNLARTSKPRQLMTNLALLEVLSHQDEGYDTTAPLRVVCVAHVFYPEMVDELVDRFDHLGDYDLVVTTDTEEKRKQIASLLGRRGRAAAIRVVESNRGRDVSALLVTCADLIAGDDYDLIVKLHSKKSPRDGANRSVTFKRHLFDNLLPSPGYARNLLRLFQEHPTLGMVFPPVVHRGYPTLGRSWFHNLKPARREAKKLGIVVPFDDFTPEAAYGSMYVARPAALRPMLRGGYTFDDFPDEDGYADGGLAHVLERLIAYGSLSEGLHVREVMSPERVAADYKLLEYQVQATGSALAPEPIYRVAQVRRWARQDRRRRRRARQEAEWKALPPLQKLKVKVKASPVATGAAPTYRAARTVYRRLRGQ